MFTRQFLIQTSLGLGFAITFLSPVRSQITPNGAGTVVNPQGNQINITGGTQAGGNLFHSFRDFNVNSAQVANFLINPQTQNILGRINGGNPSFINGLLQVTGGNSNLFLMNPAGIVFGQGASLNIPASFTATTANQIGFGNNLFNAFGDNNFSALIGNPDGFIFSTNQAGSIVNAGNLAVGTGQNISLIGGNIVNTGNINAGNITLAAVPGTNRVRISQLGHLLSLEIIPPVDSAIAPLDLPRLLTGSDLPEITSNGDTVQVAGITIPTGQGINITSGNLGTGSQGGVINVLGDRVALVNANLNASGSNGGGTIRVGGEYRGGGVNPFNSWMTYVDANSFLNADAVNSGNGGRVIVWGDDTTRFYGNISGRGVTGSGGFVEVSGKVNLAFDGRVDLLGANGLNGTLLLDPTDIVIQAGAGNGDGSLPNIALGTLPDPMTISAGALAAIAPTTAIDIQASNNITFNVPVTFAACTTGTCGGIAFTAGGIFNTNGNNITASGRDFSIRAASITAGNIDTSISTALRNGGNITLTANSGNIATADIYSRSSVTGGNAGNGGAITLNALNGSVTTNGIYSNSSSSAFSNGNSTIAGDITINAQSISTGTIDARSQTETGNAGDGGTVRLTASSGGVTTTAGIFTDSSVGRFVSGVFTGSGNASIGGDIIIKATNDVIINSSTLFGITPITPAQPLPGSLSTRSLSMGGTSGNAGDIRVMTTSGSFIARGGIYSSSNEVLYNDVMTGHGGNVNINAGGNITTSSINTSSRLNNSGIINLDAGNNITTSSIDVSSRLNSGGSIIYSGGTINLDAGNNITTSDIITSFLRNLNNSVDIFTTQTFDSRNITSITLNAGSTVTTSTINGVRGGTDVNVMANDNISFAGISGRNVNLTTRGNINVNGIVAIGIINLNADSNITATRSLSYGNSLSLNSTNGNITALDLYSEIDALAFGGNINLNAPNGSITVTSISSESDFGSGIGGNITITAGSTFLATRSFPYSINTQGVAGNGTVNITHGGSTSIPFVIGGATTNGTAGAIISGSGLNTINNLTVPVPPAVNYYGTNITIRTTAPTPIPDFLIPLIINPTPPTTPAAVVVGTPPPEPTPQPISPSPVISTPAPTPAVVVTPVITPASTVAATPVPTPQISPSPSPNTISPGTQSAIATTLTILDSPTPLSNNIEIISSTAQSTTSTNQDIPIIITNRTPTFSAESNSLRLLDQSFKEDFQSFSGISGEIATLDVSQGQDIMNRITRETNVKSAFIYVFFSPANDTNSRTRTANSARSQLFRNPSNTDTLEIVLVPPTGNLVRVKYPGLSRSEVIDIAGELTRGVARKSLVYASASKRMYELLISPLEEELKRLKIDNLVFLMDAGLRSMPIAAMQSKNKRFIIEDYSVALMPSLTLTDTTYSSLKDSQVMAMGADRFVDINLKPLPGVPVELKAINQIRGGNIFLNENFTLSNLRQNRSPEQRIVHLATHGSFYGDKVNSFIQLWGTERLTLEQIRTSGFGTPPVDLLVLSACETALGNKDAELGFAGLAVTSGVRSALASLWQVSDEGTMGLMAEFYQQLQTTTTKSEALQQAQLAMLRGEVRLEGGSLVTPKGNFTLNEELKKLGDRQLTHPYYWSAFTMIGNPW